MFWYPLRTTLQGVAQFELSGNPTNRAQGHTSALVTEKIQELTGLHPKRQEYRAAGRGPGNLGSYSIELELAEMSSTETVFLTAEWRDLVMLNYEVDPRVLDKYVPCGTVLDSFLGKTYVSLVGFRFCRTKLFGSLAVPLHSDFDEVNLRFYVRRKEGDENRRGVVFIAEIVPKQAVAMVARLIYGENYVCLPMKHHVDTDAVSSTLRSSPFSTVWRRNWRMWSARVLTLAPGGAVSLHRVERDRSRSQIWAPLLLYGGEGAGE